MVETLAGYGIPQDGIVQLVINPQTKEPISEQTLNVHFRRELDRGTTTANARVIGALFKNAVDNNNVVAQIFWLKTRARWRTFDRPDDPPPALPAPMQEGDQAADLEVARRFAFLLARAGAQDIQDAQEVTR